MKTPLSLALLALAPAVLAQNPHDGYAFWLPSGELRVGDVASERKMASRTEGGAIRLTVQPRRTRFDVPQGQLVAVFTSPKPVQRWSNIQIGENKAVPLIPVVYLEGKAEPGKGLDVRISPELPKGSEVRFYWTDDSKALDMELDKAFWGPGASGLEDQYLAAQIDRVAGRLAQARKRFDTLSLGMPTAEGRRLCRRMARWCLAEEKLATVKTGVGAYDLGLYAMVGGYWDVAVQAFRKATVLLPGNANAWYMLADATSYRNGDLDTQMADVYPLYRKAADLYSKPDANTFRNHIGLFRKLRIKDGDTERVLEMTDEQIEVAKRNWNWCAAIFEGASKGAIKMVNTFKVYDEEFDSTNHFVAKPFEGLFQPGSVETFVKMTGWGASDCCGMDCGPDRSAFMNLGMREWDVHLHEWNHSLDWAMISGELGIGVPSTHSSDWCGYQPISSMGMGHHSCNRYYMTPGMYRFVRGSDPVTTPYLTDWRLAPPTVDLGAALTRDQILDSKTMDPFVNGARAKARSLVPPSASAFSLAVPNDNGYLDVRVAMPAPGPNAAAFAQTFVYSPEKQKVRIWSGGDDNLRLWLNGRLVRNGVYWACALWTEKREKNQTSGAIVLEKGWNRLVAQISNVQRAPDWLGGDPPDQWGFSVRLCTADNKPIAGLKASAEMPDGYWDRPAFVVNPTNPKTYDWTKVADDYTTLLPSLTVDDVRKITGYSGLKVTDEMLFDLGGAKMPQGLTAGVAGKSDPKAVKLDNQLNWFFSPKEMAAVVRYRRGNQVRDLVFLRPEGFEPYLRLMRLVPEAKAKGIQDHRQQVIGYLMTQREDCPNGRGVVVVDTYLGERLPADEETLLDLNRIN